MSSLLRYRPGVCRLMLLLLVVAMSGCAVKLAYNQLDWMIPWYINDYLALEGEQKERFQQRLDDYLYWHRVDQLPRYAAFLQQVAVQAKDGLDHDEIAQIQGRTEIFADTLIQEMTPHLIALFASTDARQHRRMFKRLQKDNESYREEYIDISEREKRKQSAEKARRFVKRWVGGLSEEQETIIHRWSRTYTPMAEEILQARVAWQQRLKQILALKEQRPQAYEVELKALLENRDFGRSDGFNQKFAHNREALISLYQALDATLSAPQRKRLIQQLKHYADDFVVLSREAAAKSGGTRS